MGISTSRLCDRRAYRGRIDGEYRMRAPSVASRSRTRGWRTATGPMPVMISRSGGWPRRTTRCWPVSVLRSVCFARDSATSASTAWVSSARAPLRRISVRESVKAPGWASLMTLLSDTAYHSFIGEVEALNTTTIRRLTRSRRHQLLAIARAASLACRGMTMTRCETESRQAAAAPTVACRLEGDDYRRRLALIGKLARVALFDHQRDVTAEIPARPSTASPEHEDKPAIEVRRARPTSEA